MKQLWKRNGSCRKLTLLAFYFYTAVRRWVFLLLSTIVPSCLSPFSNILSYYFEPTQEGIDGFLSQTATWNSQAWNKLHTAQWSTKLEVAIWAEAAMPQCLQTWPWSAKHIPLPAVPKLLGRATEACSVLVTRLAVLATDLSHHYFVYSSSNLTRGPTTSTLEEIWLQNLGLREQTLGTT